VPAKDETILEGVSWRGSHHTAPLHGKIASLFNDQLGVMGEGSDFRSLPPALDSYFCIVLSRSSEQETIRLLRDLKELFSAR
jgi:hypothetical protein